jgi:hypothetical protein
MCKKGSFLKMHGQTNGQAGGNDRYAYREEEWQPGVEVPEIAKTGAVKHVPDYPVDVPAIFPSREVPVQPSRRHETIRKAIQDVPPLEVPTPERRVRVR